MAIESIKVNGDLSLGYVWVTETKLDQEQIDYVSDINHLPEWEAGTHLLATFRNTLEAGNVKDLNGKGLEGWMIYRSLYYGGEMEYVKTLKTRERFLIDYNNVWGEDYKYYLFPITDDSLSEPFVSNRVTACWNSWALLVGNKVENKDKEYKIDEIFVFDLNKSIGDINNNAEAQVYKTYTRYPKVIKGTSNFLSGQLGGLLGYIGTSIETNDLDYIEPITLWDKLQELSTDTRDKFLKDTKGHIWKVELTNPTNFSIETTSLKQTVTKTIYWTQIGDTKGLSIYNGDMKKVWLLTQDGRAKENEMYVWDNKDYWRPNYYWTETEE